ncbi:MULTISPECIES: restriction endonuclease [Clostridium]|uniref:restriction endonuclease n=1 Tax=Clostridium TaxID=1485 RepID=UPI0008252BAC|nr:MULTISPECIES: restriction endonuclease [Clostridium]PJI09634.1 restriction endonuclease [Clostridium sp. CT7]
MANWWMISSINGNENLLTKWTSNGVITFGFPEIGNPMEYDTKDKLLIKCDEVYSKETPMMRIQREGYIWKFSREIAKGDRVISYDPQDKEYYIGTVDSNYEYNPKEWPKYPSMFRVKWINKHISESSMSKNLRASLSSSSPIFMVFGCEAEMGRLIVSSGSADEILKKEKKLYNDAVQCVKNIVYSMDKNKFDSVLKDILTAMDYKVSSQFDNDNKNSYLIVNEDKLKFTKNIIRVCILENKDIVESENILNIISKYSDQISNYLIVTDKPIEKEILAEVTKKYFIINMSGKDMVKAMFCYYDKLDSKIKNVLLLKKMYI